jgi:methanogenic corrinoid protein MtbC1
MPMVMRAAGDGARAGYSIRVASRLTGLSSDTLRMWERRYGFPTPARNPAGVRVYSPEHVERLLLVARTLKAGYRAGEVVTRTRDELSELLASTAGASASPGSAPSPVDGLLAKLEGDDFAGFVAELRRHITTLGPRAFLVDVCSPLVERVGEAWATRDLDVHHEHMATSVISTQLRLLLAAYEGTTRDPLVLLATLPGEQHALGMEMAALYVALSGATPRILGVDAPPDQIARAAKTSGARVVGVSVSASAEAEAVSEDLGWMLRELPQSTRVWVGGRRAKSLGLSDPRVTRVTTWQELDAALAALC